MTVSNDYKFKGMALTPSICMELIIELFQGRIVERKDIHQEVVAVHQTRGGKPARAADSVGTIKKALKTLLNEKRVENPGRGYWRIGGEKLNYESIGNIEELEKAEVEIDSFEEDALDEELKDIEFGTVYLYYFPTYKNYAELTNTLTWRCKIGRTDGDPLIRITSQGVTALPEKPIIISVQTLNSRVLESIIHKILTLNGKKTIDAPGDEWFDTNPEEFMNIVEFVEKEKYKEKIAPLREG